MDHCWDGYKVTMSGGKHVKKHLLLQQNRESTTSSLDNKCSITATTGMKIGTNLCQHYNHNLLLPKKTTTNKLITAFCIPFPGCIYILKKTNLLQIVLKLSNDFPVL